jgi:hypothetical protein
MSVAVYIRAFVVDVERYISLLKAMSKSTARGTCGN